MHAAQQQPEKLLEQKRYGQQQDQSPRNSKEDTQKDPNENYRYTEPCDPASPFPAAGPNCSRDIFSIKQTHLKFLI